MWLGDSGPARPWVVAVLANQIDLAQTVLLPWALRDAHTSAHCAAAVAGGGTVTSAAGYVSAADTPQSCASTLLLIAMPGLALAYSAAADATVVR